MTDGERRFSLDPIKADPSLRNLIYSADGDETVGEWNGEDIHDLVRELDRIEERVDANYNSLPHSDNIPEDLRGDIEKDCSVKIITSKDSEGLDAIRHDATHIMAMAVQELFPGTKIAIGPAIKDGFYYDFSRKEPFTPQDLEKIEIKMKEIVENDELTRREVWERKKATDHYKKIGEDYKVQLVDSIPEDQEVSVYYHGKWYDLCRGPH